MDRTQAAVHLIAVTRGTAATISSKPAGQMTLEDIQPIEQTMAMVTPEALGMVPYAHLYVNPAATLPGDIRYLHIAQEETFSIGVFVFPPRACIPLHDHPNMSVVSRVLYGSVKITCYDRHAEDSAAVGRGDGGPSPWTPGSWFGGGFGRQAAAAAAAAMQQQPHQHQLASLRESSWRSAPHTSHLTPTMANVHELEAGIDGTAILDVLIPPYDEASGRDCTYYRPEHVDTGESAAAGGGGSGGGGCVRLVPCSPGDDFRVVRGEFSSPFPS